ncbi:primosomal protein I [Pantoea agglomerans]
MSISTPTQDVLAIGRISISGNVIPSTWWHRIKLPSGRTDQTAITLLSDIVYWYRPSEVRNENTGELIGYRKRFHGDKLQRSYQSFANQFGFTKRETTDALKRLRDLGLITLELRTVQTSDGMTLANVLFVGVIPEAIADITHAPSYEAPTNKTGTPPTLKRNTPPTLKRNTPHVETEGVSRSDVGNPTFKRETYTETTTEITTENKNPSCPDASRPDDTPVDNPDQFLARYPDAVVYSEKKRLWGSHEDLKCAEWIWGQITRLYEQAAEADGELARPKEPNWAAWANDVRLMCSQDQRTHFQICKMFKRVQNDPFWCRNILSPAKLREKWDELVVRLGPVQRSVTDISPVDYAIPEGFRGY